GRFDFPADMIGQVSIRTRACRTGATGDRRRWRSLEKAIHAGARDIPRARDPRQAITTRRGRRDRLAHRLDLLRAKGLLASMAAILADSNSLSMVISPTLDFSRAISSSRSSRSRSFSADAAPASARSRHSVSLATETFASRATTSSGSPRNKRATTAILRWTEYRFGPASTPEGAPAPAMGERSGAPSGFSPASIVISKPPVEVQLPQPDVSANRDAPKNLSRPTPSRARSRSCCLPASTAHGPSRCGSPGTGTRPSETDALCEFALLRLEEDDAQGGERPIRRCRRCAAVRLYVAGVCLNRIGTVRSSAERDEALFNADNVAAGTNNEPRRHLIIAGTGRAGTSFLVRYLTELGLDTILTREGEAAWWD